MEVGCGIPMLEVGWTAHGSWAIVWPCVERGVGGRVGCTDERWCVGVAVGNGRAPAHVCVPWCDGSIEAGSVSAVVAVVRIVGGCGI